MPPPLPSTTTKNQPLSTHLNLQQLANVITNSGRTLITTDEYKLLCFFYRKHPLPQFKDTALIELEKALPTLTSPDPTNSDKLKRMERIFTELADNNQITAQSLHNGLLKMGIQQKGENLLSFMGSAVTFKEFIEFLKFCRRP